MTTALTSEGQIVGAKTERKYPNEKKSKTKQKNKLVKSGTDHSGDYKVQTSVSTSSTSLVGAFFRCTKSNIKGGFLVCNKKFEFLRGKGEKPRAMARLCDV